MSLLITYWAKWAMTSLSSKVALWKHSTLEPVCKRLWFQEHRHADVMEIKALRLMHNMTPCKRGLRLVRSPHFSTVFLTRWEPPCFIFFTSHFPEWQRRGKQRWRSHLFSTLPPLSPLLQIVLSGCHSDFPSSPLSHRPPPMTHTPLLQTLPSHERPLREEMQFSPPPP